MPFDVELAFTGLGVVLFRSAEETHHNPRPDSVEFLLLRTQESAPQDVPQEAGSGHGPEDEHHGGHHHSGGSGVPPHAEPHLPRLWFRLEDLVAPEGALFENMAAGPEGLPVVGLPLAGKDFTITVEEEVATEGQQGFDVQWRSREERSASSNRDPGGDLDLDLIPDLKEHFGLDPILPDTGSLPDAYTARVTLPAGRIATRRPLLDPGTALAGWVFVESDGTVKTDPQPMADQVLWTRRGIKALHIDGVLGGRLTLDASMRERYGEGSRITLAITNLPGTATSGRFGLPGHFAFLQQLAKKEQRIRDVQRQPPLAEEIPITVGGACPPARQEGTGT